MANAGTVTVDFAAEVAKFNASLKQVNDRVKSVESGFKSLEKVAQTALSFFSVGIAVRFVQSAADAADALGKMADKLGISTERLTAFQLAAEDAGVETGSLNKLLTDAQRRLGDAANGTGEALKTIQAFGFNIRDLQRLSPDELFLKYADAIGTLSNRSDQFSAAQALFGKTAQESFTIIAAGRPAIEEAAANVEKFGLALSRVEISKIEEANDALGLLSKTSQAFGQHVAAAFAPFTEEFAKRLTETAGAANNAQTSLQAFAKGVFVSFEIIANAARTFDVAVSAAFFGFFKAIEGAAGGIARIQEFQAGVDRFLGADTIAKQFEDGAARLRGVEAFSAAASEQAAARIKAALDNTKSFVQILEQANTIAAQSQAKAEEAAAAQQQINEALRQPAENPQVDAFNTNNLLQEDLQRQHFEVMLQIQREFQEASAQLTKQLDVDEFIRHQQIRQDAAIAAESAILQARTNAQNAALGLLSALAARSKTAAIALVAINKAVAVAQAIQNTSVAVTKTLAAYGGTPAGYAAAASVKAWGALEVAAIIASGVAEIQQIRSSPSAGAPIGSPTNPVFTETGGADQTIGGQSRSEITVIVEGVVTPGAAISIAEALKDVIDNSDIRIIGKNSAQADEIRRGI